MDAQSHLTDLSRALSRLPGVGRRSAERMALAQGHMWYDYWADMLPIYEAFEAEHRVPQVGMIDRRYVLAGQ